MIICQHRDTLLYSKGKLLEAHLLLRKEQTHEQRLASRQKINEETRRWTSLERIPKRKAGLNSASTSDPRILRVWPCNVPGHSFVVLRCFCFLWGTPVLWRRCESRRFFVCKFGRTSSFSWAARVGRRVHRAGNSGKIDGAAVLRWLVAGHSDGTWQMDPPSTRRWIEARDSTSSQFDRGRGGGGDLIRNPVRLRRSHLWRISKSLSECP